MNHIITVASRYILVSYAKIPEPIMLRIELCKRSNCHGISEK